MFVRGRWGLGIHDLLALESEALQKRWHVPKVPHQTGQGSGVLNLIVNDFAASYMWKENPGILSDERTLRGDQALIANVAHIHLDLEIARPSQVCFE
jgi:hypothetical protein